MLPPLLGHDVVYYQATSRDGFVTDAAGSAGWQAPYFIPELGFHDFIARVAGIVLGGATLEAILASGHWPYGQIPGIAVSDRPVAIAGAPLRATNVDPSGIVAAAKLARAGPTWVVGDSALARRLIAADLMTRIDLFILPVTLGAGLDAFAEADLVGFEMIDTEAFPNEVVRKTYAPSTRF